jgi:hypothetical protein
MAERKMDKKDKTTNNDLQNIKYWDWAIGNPLRNSW